MQKEPEKWHKKNPVRSLSYIGSLVDTIGPH